MKRYDRPIRTSMRKLDKVRERKFETGRESMKQSVRKCEQV